MSATLSHCGLSSGISRSQFIGRVKLALKAHGLKTSAIQYLAMAFNNWTRDQDYEPERICGFWHQASGLADELTCTERTVHSIEREFSKNFFHLRHPIVDPLPGTLTEAEIHTRLIEEMGGLKKSTVTMLRLAARLGTRAFAAAFGVLVAANKDLMKIAPAVLYRTLGQTLNGGKTKYETRYPEGLRARTVRMVLDQESEYLSRPAAILLISQKAGCCKDSLRIRLFCPSGVRPPITT